MEQIPTQLAKKMPTSLQTLIYSFLETLQLFKTLDNVSHRHRKLIGQCFFEQKYTFKIDDRVKAYHTVDTIDSRFTKIMRKCNRLEIDFNSFEPIIMRILTHLRLPKYKDITR